MHTTDVIHTTDVFSMLSPAMRKVVYDMGWSALSPIQLAAIPTIMAGDSDCILCAETAAGKTEAAFLPILSMIEAFGRQQIAVLYISPLKALINDQYQRIGDLCSRLDIAVHRWHGDVSTTRKQKTIAQPSGILQITPESLESLMVNRSSYLFTLFHGLKFIVIDELHAFLDSSRGIHLRSLLHRLTRYTESPPRHIGLSATIGDPLIAQQWLSPTNPSSVTFVQLPKNKK
jgi:ATP-dependent Lhr-like helicase